MATNPSFSKQVSTPLLISLIGIATTTMAILIYHLVIIKYCQSRRRHHQSTNTPPHSDTDSPIRSGLDPKLLELIPAVRYNSDLIKSDQAECVICLGELEEGAWVRLLPNCQHAFHVSCVDQWFVGHANCPICRSPIIVPMLTTCGEVGPAVFVQEISCRPIVLHKPLASQQPHDCNITVCDVGPTLTTCGEVGPAVTSCRPNVPHKPLASQNSHDYDRKGHSGGLLRHCASVDSPAGVEEGLGLKLKRSYSMDESFLVGIEMGRSESHERGGCSSSSSSCSNRFDRPVRHLDRVSARLLRSFSRLRMGTLGRGGTGNEMLLPY